MIDLRFHARGPGPFLVYGGFAFVVVGILHLVFYRLLKAPTKAGSKITARIEGFRKFLAVNYGMAHGLSERSETDAPPFLEKCLPYAIALGIDSEYVAIRAKNLQWYAGKPGDFSPYEFTSSLKTKQPGAKKSSPPLQPRRTGAGL